AAGVIVHLLPEPLPTPVLAFAVRRLGAAAGIMVTASHNPPQDSGYKVYDATGSQIASPVDTVIAEAMEAIGPLSQLPRVGGDDPSINRRGDDIAAAYVEAAASVSERTAAAGDLVIAYTPLHGVGAATMHRVLGAAGLPAPVDVVEQREPDPDFPTVPFPNPEEPGALDLGLRTAATSDADLLLANDPDADRLGVAVPDPDLGSPSNPEGWRVLTGAEIGAILADHILTRGIRPGE